MDKLKVRICNGSACRKAGAFPLYAFEDALPEELRSFIDWEFSDECIGLCKFQGAPPFAQVGRKKVAIATPERVLQAVKDQLA